MHNPQQSFCSDTAMYQCKEFELNNNYLIYSDGRVYSNYVSRFMSTPIDNSRYRRVNFKIPSLNKKTVKYLVHRLVAQTFIPNPLNLGYVNHIDGDKLNNDVSNLEWVTASENQKHAYRIGLKSSAGVKNSRSILNETQVLAIHDRMLLGESSSGIAKDLKLGLSMVENIRAHRTWKVLLKGLPHPPRSDKHTLHPSDTVVIQVANDLMKRKPYLKIVADSNGLVTKSLVEDIRHSPRFKHLTDSIFYPEVGSTTIENAKKVA